MVKETFLQGTRKRHAHMGGWKETGKVYAMVRNHRERKRNAAEDIRGSLQRNTGG